MSWSFFPALTAGVILLLLLLLLPLCMLHLHLHRTVHRRMSPRRGNKSQADAYGLREVTLQETRGRAQHIPDFGADIVFVHGLGANQTSSWSTREVNWVSEYLFPDLRNADIDQYDVRLFLYGYDSSWMLDAPGVDIHRLAQTLLDTLATRQEKDRRVIFAAHSHGGLLVKEALVIDRLHDGGVLSRTDGILFFGTPHQGSTLAGLGRVVATLLSPWGADVDLLAFAMPSSKTSWSCHEKFMAVLKHRQENDELGPIQIWNFYEERRSVIFDFGQGFKLTNLVVERSSATFHFADCQNFPLQRDHRQLNKFRTRDGEYRKVLKAITTCIDHSAKKKISVFKQTISKCLDSLRFKHMDSRRAHIAPAHQGTCDWLFQTEQFHRWWEPDAMQSHNGILWIKGKPGAGKSTLMKHVLLYCQRTLPNHIIAAYFLNARAVSTLEKTPLGMLRSLLFQLLQQDQPLLRHHFLPKYLEKYKTNERFQWQERELCTFLIESLASLSKPLLLLVDALDECDESAFRQVVRILELLGDTAIDAKINLHICVSSRDCPNVTIEKSLSLVIEAIEDHIQDIAIYVRSHLKANNNIIEEKLLEKASGIFMWAVLVVELLNRAYDTGKMRAMQTKLEEVPDELEDVVWALLGDDNAERQKTVLMLQWVLFARRPLEPLELYHAVLAGTEPLKLVSWNLLTESSDIVRRFITSSSKGLVEIAWGRAQFIHGSVIDFLLRNRRLQRLDPSLKENIIGASHDRLRACCIDYLMAEELWQTVRQGSRRRSELARAYPFLRYAASYVLEHAEEAQAQGFEQGAVVQLEPEKIKRLALFHHYFSRHTSVRCGSKAGLLYILLRHKYEGLWQLYLSENRTDLNHAGSWHGSALQLASVNETDETVSLLLQKGADVNVKGGHYGYALQAASARGNIKMVELFIANGADVNQKGGHYGTALQAASASGRKEIVELLIQSGADVNQQGGHYDNALQAASARREKTIVELLIQAGAHINAQGGNYGTALQAASIVGREEILELLVQNGADINIRGGYYGSALQAALVVRDQRVVELLLQYGADLSILSQKEKDLMLRLRKGV